MSSNITRRDLVKGAGIAAGAAAVGLGSASLTMPLKAENGMEYPWPMPKKFRTKKIMDRAYESYFKAGCMFGVMDGVAGYMADKIGEPYTNFPFLATAYGAGGVSLWGTICGTLNGAALAVSLFAPKSQGGWAIINELMAWYENNKLPKYTPKNPVKVEKGFRMPRSEAESPLCHASISQWTTESGYDAFSPQRAERCARLVADIAGLTADLLNDFRKGKFKAGRQISHEAEHCLACHTQEGGDTLPFEPQILSKMECTTCHEDHTGRFDGGLRTKY